MRMFVTGAGVATPAVCIQWDHDGADRGLLPMGRSKKVVDAGDALIRKMAKEIGHAPSTAHRSWLGSGSA